MLENLRKKSVNVAAAALLSSAAVSACSSPGSKKTSVTQEIPTTSIVPPLARQGVIVNCVMETNPKTLAEAGVANAAQALSPSFHQSPAEIAADARYGLAMCDRSITAEMAKKMGFVVRVSNIDPSYDCITWTALYNNRTEAQTGGPTNHIGLVCIPPAVQTPQITA